MSRKLRDRIMVRWLLWKHGPSRVARLVYVTLAYLRGARRTRTGGDSCGVYCADGALVEFGGNCPVQGYGEIDGFLVYYRSRGEGWELSFFRSDEDLETLSNPVFEFGERKYIWPDGGWIDTEVSLDNIARGVAAFRESR